MDQTVSQLLPVKSADFFGVVAGQWGAIRKSVYDALSEHGHRQSIMQLRVVDNRDNHYGFSSVRTNFALEEPVYQAINEAIRRFWKSATIETLYLTHNLVTEEDQEIQPFGGCCCSDGGHACLCDPCHPL